MHLQIECAASKQSALSTLSSHPAKWRRGPFFVNQSSIGLSSGGPILYRLNEKAAHSAILFPCKVARARSSSN
jgi:hypothetical protein